MKTLNTAGRQLLLQLLLLLLLRPLPPPPPAQIDPEGIIKSAVVAQGAIAHRLALGQAVGQPGRPDGMRHPPTPWSNITGHHTHTLRLVCLCPACPPLEGA